MYTVNGLSNMHMSKQIYGKIYQAVKEPKSIILLQVKYL